MNSEDIDRAVGAAFGRPGLAGPAGVRSVALEAFRDAGFCDEDAERGVRLLESGNYLGFEDVALSMGTFDQDVRARNPAATSRRIRETSVRYIQEAAARASSATFVDGVRVPEDGA